MKNYCYLVLFAVLVVACGQSQKQKAEALIKETLERSLIKPDTYTPIETKVEEAFAPYDDPAFLKELTEMINMTVEYADLMEKAKHAKLLMSKWSAPYRSSDGKDEYQEAIKVYDEANAKIEEIKIKTRKQDEKIANMLLEDRKFLGYKAIHTYRAVNNAGNTFNGNTVFFIDKNFEKVVYSMDVEDYNQVQGAVKIFKEG